MNLITNKETPNVEPIIYEDGKREKRYKSGKMNVRVMYNEPSDRTLQEINKYYENKYHEEKTVQT